MSTQASAFPPISFSVASTQQSFRLLELPPELLTLLTSQHRPTTLDLKSSLPTNDRPGTKAASEYLHLCTNTKSWAIRQVSTSNSVYVTSPTSNRLSNEPTCLTAGLTAISKPASHLELIPLTPDADEIKSAIGELIPILTSAEPSTPLPSSLTPEDLVNSLPYPCHLIISNLRSLFTFSTNNQLYIPSPALLLDTWRKVIQYAAANNCTFDRFLWFNLTTIVEDILSEEGSSAGSPGQIYYAIIGAISEKFADVSTAGERSGLMTEAAREAEAPEYPFQQHPLDKRGLTIFVGQLLVRCAGAKGIEKTKLSDEWSNLLPSRWEQYLDLDRLGDGYKMTEEDGKSIVWYAVASSKATVIDTASKPATATGKRKWHEKFAAQRRQ